MSELFRLPVTIDETMTAPYAPYSKPLWGVEFGGPLWDGEPTVYGITDQARADLEAYVAETMKAIRDAERGA